MINTTFDIETEIEFMAGRYILNRLKYLYTGFVEVHIKDGLCTVAIHNKDRVDFEKSYNFDYLNSNSNEIIAKVKNDYKRFIYDNVTSKYFITERA
jgi:hypothetical protein